MQPKVGIFANWFHPSMGGVEVSSRLMAQALTGLGMPATVLTRSPLENADELDEGYRIVRTRSSVAALRWARDVDIVILRGGMSRFAAPPAIATSAVLVCFHEMANPDGQKPDPVTRALMRFVHTHVGVTASVLDSKFLAPDARRFVLYNPVADALWSNAVEGYGARRTDILYVGRITRAKGVFDLAEAIGELSRTCRVDIVGEGPDRAALECRLEAMSHIDAVFHGRLHGKELRQRYTDSKLLVVPSDAHKEGMGMVVAEAMANGTPVVASDQAPLIETVGAGGLVFPAGSAEALRDRIAFVLSDPEIWQAFQARALEERNRFSMEAYQVQLAELIDTVRADRQRRD